MLSLQLSEQCWSFPFQQAHLTSTQEVNEGQGSKVQSHLEFLHGFPGDNPDGWCVDTLLLLHSRLFQELLLQLPGDCLRGCQKHTTEAVLTWVLQKKVTTLFQTQKVKLTI